LQGLRPNALRQRLQAAVPRDGRAGASLRFVGQVKVLELRLRCTSSNTLAQKVREFALLFDLSEDSAAPSVELDQVRATFLDGANLHLIETSRSLLAITRNERHGAPLHQEL